MTRKREKASGCLKGPPDTQLADTAGVNLLCEYLTPDQLASQLGVSERTLSRWHTQRLGPPRCAIGKLILYRVDAVREWMAEREAIPAPCSTPRRHRHGRGR